MAETPKLPNPELNSNGGDGAIQTPEAPNEGTEGEQTPQTTPESEGLPPQEDYKKKFSESTRQNQLIQEELRIERENRAELEDKLKNETTSEIEISRKYPDWEFKEEDEKERIRREEVREKRLQQLEEKEAWKDDYARVLREYPQLAESEEDFKKEAYKHPKSTDLKIIAKSFLFDRTPVTAETPTETPVRQGLESPTGGPKTPLSTGMTLEDITRLRKEEPQKYSDMVRKGLIKVPKA